MVKFLSFMEKHRDPFLKIKLTDLARTLAQSNDLDMDYAFLSYYMKGDHLVTVSNYWDELMDPRKEDAMKSDIYLRAFGNYHFTNYQIVTAFLNKTSQSSYPNFFKQLFALTEDCRLEIKSIRMRPGMTYAFSHRRDLFIKRFSERYRIHRDKQEWLGALFSAIYLQLAEKPVALPSELSYLKPHLRKLNQDTHTYQSTKDVAVAMLEFKKQLHDDYQDMQANYFTMYEAAVADPTHNEELEKKPELETDMSREVENKDEKETHDETLPSWSEESSDDDSGDNFLQFDLDQGEKSDLIGEGERKMDAGDQAFANVQGESQDSEGNDFDSASLASEREPKAASHHDDANGEANRHATLVIKKREPATLEDEEAYKSTKAQIQPLQKPLQMSIQKTIEQKQIAPKTDLHFGRLNKKLLRVVTDRNPRLFYKKSEPSKRLDVTFTLLVDCSASMIDKMDETKAGIVLFHETLQSLQIPHRIVGFWEDALDADNRAQPNYLYDVIPFEKSLLPKQGTFIMQLEPEEDNRDGFVIRKAAESMATRSEKHKILLVFTDGEPSAFDYTENGIVDTHEAVTMTRRRGTEVIGVFLSNGEPQEKEIETMKNIYGRESLIVPSVEEIPATLTPLLKKLLLKYI